MPHEPYSHVFALDYALYDSLDEHDVIFLKAQTGIQDDFELREHILQIQREAYAVHAYPCIRIFGFAKGDIAQHPAYQQALVTGRTDKAAIFLDLGCCMGSDIRKAISDGFPLEQIIASDLVPEFWTLGHKLFRTNQKNFPVPFLAGDIFDDNFCSPTISPALEKPPPPTSTLTSLTPLQRHISIIRINLFFHLFEKDKQRDLAIRLAMLLSPTPGSMIFGRHRVAEDTYENRDGGLRFSERGTWTFGHSPTSWRNLWVGTDGVFRFNEAKVEATTTSVQSKTKVFPGQDVLPMLFMMQWSVVRL